VAGPSYTVDWAVSDGDLATVEVALVNGTDHVVDIESQDVSGNTDSGRTTVTDSDGSSGTIYEVRLTVYDERGGDTTANVTDIADGTDL
jgi:hypothetical protein